jgi:hypothetical protein
MPRVLTLTDAELRELAAAYAQGLSIRALASARGWSYGATHAKLQLAEVKGLMTIRHRGARSSLTQRG